LFQTTARSVARHKLATRNAPPDFAAQPWITL
jgi:hypothetical protein